jgi:tetratricopeptide (TPR) repeat protein
MPHLSRLAISSFLSLQTAAVPLAVVTGGILFTPPAAAQAPAAKINPSDVYFRGYLIQEEGMKLLEQKNYAAAYYKLYDASQLFDSVAQADPNWEPTIVEYRRKRVRELMEEARIQEKARRERVAEQKGTVNPEPRALPMDSAPKALPSRGVESYVADKTNELKDKISQMEAKNDALQREIGVRDEKLRQTGREMLDLQKSQGGLLERLKTAESAVQTAETKNKREQEDLRKQVAKLTKEKEELRVKLTETAELLKKATDANLQTVEEVQQAYAQIKQLTADKEQLTKEKAALETMLGGNGDGANATFAASNAKLRAQLAEFEAKVKTLQKERDDARGSEAAMKAKLEENQKMVLQLQTELESARKELNTLKQQNVDYEQQMAAMQARLTETEQALGESGMKNGAIDENAMAENRILHQLVLKMLKQQATHMKAKEQAVQLLEQSGKVSQDLLNSLTEMAAPYQLSASERAVMNAMGAPATTLPGGGPGMLIELVGDVGAEKPEGADLPPDTSQPNPTGALDRQGLSPELKGYATAAETHFRNQEYVQAEESFQRILDREPRNIYALSNLARVQMQRNKMGDVEVHLKKALAYQYDNDFTHLLLGAAYLRQNRYADAMGSINEALKIKPENSDAHASLGFLHYQQKNLTEAEKSLVEAVRLNPTNGEAHLNLAIIYAVRWAKEPGGSLLNLVKSHYKKALEQGAKPDSGLDKLMQNS